MSEASIEVAETATHTNRQLLTFFLDDVEYGIPLLTVREIRAHTPVTRLPNSPAWVTGVINLRGTIVPVIDLRARIGSPNGGVQPMAVVIVVKPAEKTVGLLVDRVSDVVAFQETHLHEPPTTDTQTEPQFVASILQQDERLVVVLDAARLVEPGTVSDAA